MGLGSGGTDHRTFPFVPFETLVREILVDTVHFVRPDLSFLVVFRPEGLVRARNGPTLVGHYSKDRRTLRLFMVRPNLRPRSESGKGFREVGSRVCTNPSREDDRRDPRRPLQVPGSCPRYPRDDVPMSCCLQSGFRVRWFLVPD